MFLTDHSRADLQPIYSGRRVLITGGLGFIGSNLALAAESLGAQVTVVDSELYDSGANRFNIFGFSDRIRLIAGDIGDSAVAREAVMGQDFVFNMAGTPSHVDSMKNPIRDLYANCSAHITLLETVRAVAPRCRILYAGTRGQYGKALQSPVTESHPLASLDTNGVNKTAGEAYHLLYAQQYGLFASSIRLANVYGPRHQMLHSRQGILNWFVRLALEGRPLVIFGSGDQIRDMNFVGDVVEAMLMTLASPASRGEVYNLGGVPMSLNGFAELLIRLNRSGKVIHQDYPQEAKTIEVGDYIADWSKIRAQIGWKPKTSNEEGLAETLQFYRKHGSHYFGSPSDRSESLQT